MQTLLLIFRRAVFPFIIIWKQNFKKGPFKYSDIHEMEPAREIKGKYYIPVY